MKGKKSSSFDKEGIESLAKEKPVVYDIEDSKGKILYTGSAKKGRVEQRIKEHLPGGPDPIRGGKKVRIKQKSSIADAQQSEKRAIKKNKPPFNKTGN